MRGTLVMALDRKGCLRTACWNDTGPMPARQNELYSRSGLPENGLCRASERKPRGRVLSSGNRPRSRKEEKP